MVKVITYGTYDMLHRGHIRLLERAKALGDYLIVGVTADDFDKTRGKINVQQSLMERIDGIKSTGLADEIIVEEYEGQKIDDIKKYDVDIFTVGSDWKGKFDYLNEYCKVVYLERTQGVSSTEIREQKRQLRMGLVGESKYLCKLLKESTYVNGFSTNYESIIRAIRSKYPDCSIISILESSQREYTEKMTTIQSICEHYSIPVADTIASFNNSGKAYDDLTGDGVHPNEAGQGIYFETVKAVIDDNVAASTGKMAEADVINADVHKFDNFVWYDASSDFVRVDDTTFTISTNASGILGIDYTYESGDNKADIYVDGELFESPTVTFDYDFSQRHILVVSDDCTVKNEIKVVFTSKEQADGFKGMCFSWE